MRAWPLLAGLLLLDNDHLVSPLFFGAVHGAIRATLEYPHYSIEKPEAECEVFLVVLEDEATVQKNFELYGSVLAKA